MQPAGLHQTIERTSVPLCVRHQRGRELPERPARGPVALQVERVEHRSWVVAKRLGERPDPRLADPVRAEQQRPQLAVVVDRRRNRRSLIPPHPPREMGTTSDRKHQSASR